MKKLAIIFAFLLMISVLVPADNAKPKAEPKVVADIFPVSEVRTGMRGVAYTVFEGVTPEAMDVEVLGVMRNAQGPKSNIILVRLHGKKVEFSGVVAGMSGSPVYFNGKLAGAIAYRIGEFSKEPIAGVTPIEEMLEIEEIDRSQPEEAVRGSGARSEMTKTSGPGVSPTAVPTATYANYLKPIETPLVFSGFSEEAVQQFLPQFAAAGMTPVIGAGSVSNEAQPEPLVPGSAVSAVLVRGDLNIASTCTVTYVDPERLLACGHPLMNFGSVELPMNKARVLATLPSPANAFKIVNTTERVGAWVQDRHTGILGRFGKEPKMVPVTLTVRGAGTESKTYHYEVLNNSRLTPTAMMSTVFTAVRGTNVYGEDVTYTLSGNISVKGYADVKLKNMFAPAETGNNPTALAVATDIGNRFGQIYQNPWAVPDIAGVHIDLQMTRERRWARLESARTDTMEVRPGDEVIVEAVLRPYRGERIVRQIPVKVPTSAPKGTLRILVSDGDTLDRMRRVPPAVGRKLDLASSIALLNKDHANNALYVSLLDPSPQAMVEDKVMPTLPLSVMNVMEPMRGTQDMVVMAESAVNEASTPLDYVVSGAQIISVTVK